MSRTGKRANALRSLLAGAGVTITTGTLPRPSLSELHRAGLEASVLHVYRALGGTQKQLRINPGGWDLEADGVAIELDEDLHFNRYRRLTLDSPLYERLSFDCDLYHRLCDEYARDCLSAGQWGKRWTVDRAELEIGPAAAPGDFTGGGAPRWKQRAFYDFIKDTAPIVFGFKLSRMPIWEPITSDHATYSTGVLLELVAEGAVGCRDWAEAILAHVRERTFTAAAPLQA
jgi:hypothetical protein